MEITRPAPTRDETPTSVPAVAPADTPDLRTGMNTAAVLALQRSAGNRAVAGLLGRRALARQDLDGAPGAGSSRAGALDVTGHYGERARRWSAERTAWSVELNQAGEHVVGWWQQHQHEGGVLAGRLSGQLVRAGAGARCLASVEHSGLVERFVTAPPTEMLLEFTEQRGRLDLRLLTVAGDAVMAELVRGGRAPAASSAALQGAPDAVLATERLPLTGRQQELLVPRITALSAAIGAAVRSSDEAARRAVAPAVIECFTAEGPGRINHQQYPLVRELVERVLGASQITVEHRTGTRLQWLEELTRTQSVTSVENSARRLMGLPDRRQELTDMMTGSPRGYRMRLFEGALSAPVIPGLEVQGRRGLVRVEAGALTDVARPASDGNWGATEWSHEYWLATGGLEAGVQMELRPEPGAEPFESPVSGSGALGWTYATTPAPYQVANLVGPVRGFGADLTALVIAVGGSSLTFVGDGQLPPLTFASEPPDPSVTFPQMPEAALEGQVGYLYTSAAAARERLTYRPGTPRTIRPRLAPESDLFFATDQDVLDGSGRAFVETFCAENLAVLRAPGTHVNVLGHASLAYRGPRERGREYNARLAERRALAVATTIAHALGRALPSHGGKGVGEALRDGRPEGDDHVRYRRVDVHVNGELALRVYGG